MTNNTKYGSDYHLRESYVWSLSKLRVISYDSYLDLEEGHIRVMDNYQFIFTKLLVVSYSQYLDIGHL